MTIDEAIAHAREAAEKNREAEAMFLHDDLIWNAKQERKLAEEHEQLAEWLEELKEARKGFNENRKAGYKHGYSDGYNKAIDDFFREIKIDVIATTFGLRICDAERIAQRLKEGGKND